MKTEYLPVVVALVAASASVAGVAYTQYGAVKLERQKWEQAQADIKRKSLEDAVFAYARDIGAALQQVELLSWTATNDPDSITSAAILAYDKGSADVLNKIAGHRLVLAAQNPQAAEATDKAANAFYAADACITKAGVQLRTDRNSGIAALEKCKSLGSGASAVLFKEFRAILARPATEHR